MLVCSLVGTTAMAQTDEDLARTHFEAGQGYYERGDFEEAVREFGRAYELSNRPELLHNIYLAYRDLQDDANAATYLRRYLGEVDDLPNRPLLERRLRELEAALAQTADEDDASEGHGAAWGVLVSGAAIAIGGAIAGGLALQSRNTLDEDWCEGTRCREGFEDERDRGDRSAMAANVLLAVGGAAIVVAIPLFFLGGDDDEPTARLSCGPSGCMGSVRGTF